METLVLLGCFGYLHYFGKCSKSFHKILYPRMLIFLLIESLLIYTIKSLLILKAALFNRYLSSIFSV